MQLSNILSVYFTALTLTLSLIVAIGAQNAFVLQQAIRRQYVTAVVALCIALDSILMTIGVLGLGSIIGKSPQLLRWLAIAGGAALVWYGIQALQRMLTPQALTAEDKHSHKSMRKVLLELLLISLLNPHVYLDTVVLVGSIGARQPENLRVVFLLGSCSASLVWFVVLGYGGSVLRPLFAKPIAWKVLDGLVAAMMFTLAYMLIMQGWNNTVL